MLNRDGRLQLTEVATPSVRPSTEEHELRKRSGRSRRISAELSQQETVRGFLLKPSGEKARREPTSRLVTDRKGAFAKSSAWLRFLVPS